MTKTLFISRLTFMTAIASWVSLAGADEPTHVDESVKQAFYGVVAGVTTEEELLANPIWNQPGPLKKTLDSQTENILEYQFGIWKKILVAIDSDRRVRIIEVTPPERARAEELARVLQLGELIPLESGSFHQPLSLSGESHPPHWQAYGCSRGVNVMLLIEEVNGKLYAHRLLFYVPISSFLGLQHSAHQHSEVSRLAEIPSGEKIALRVQVDDVFPDSPAERAGFQVGDYVLEVAGKPVENSLGLLNAIRGLPVGSRHRVKVFRANREIELSVLISPPNFTSTTILRAQKLHAQEAIDLFTTALKLQTDDRYLHYFRAEALQKLGQYQEAINDYSRAIELGLVRTSYGPRAINYARIGEFKKASDDIEQAFSQKDPQAYTARGFLHQRMNRHEEALADYQQALVLHPNHIRVLYFRGVLRFDRQEYDEAITDCDQILRIDPGNLLARIGKSNALIGKKDYQEAIKVLEPLLENPEPTVRAEGHHNTSICYWHLQQWNQALFHANQAIDFDQSFGSAYQVRGLIHKQLGNEQQAEADHQRYRELTEKIK